MKSDDDRAWWYEKSGQKTGPMNFAAMCGLIRGGEISPGTLIWTDGMSEWIKAEGISQLSDVFASTPPPLPPPLENDASRNISNDAATDSRRSDNSTEHLATPWPRFFARLFDIWLEGLPAGFLLGIVLYAVDAEMADEVFSNAVAVGIVSLPLIMVIDGIVVGLAGNSLGKAILGIKVLPNGSKSFSVGPAIGRNMSVWFRGLAVGVPIVNLFTMSSAYNQLKAGHRLEWDKVANVRVVRAGTEPWRYVIFVILFTLLFWLNVVGSLPAS